MTYPFWIFYFITFFITHEPGEKPSDWFYRQRAWPFDSIPQQVYQRAVGEARLKAKANYRQNNQAWKFAGPMNIGGRITDVEGVSGNSNIFYIGAASGGVFKTTNAGQTWQPIFDQNPILSIGDMAIHPGNPNILFVGTGEANGGGGSVSYEGNGIFKTTDGGISWQYLGLEQSGSIPKILIHPFNDKIIYVAAMGRMFGKNKQRGVFKSTNGGDTWEQVLFHSDSVGAVDLILDPRHPDTLYASLWERSRRPSGIDYGGPACGIYRSFDGGKVWTNLNQGLPTGDNLGRIGIALSASSPQVIYAYYMDESGDFLGIYRSENYGNTWAKTNGRVNVANFGWWFGKIYVSPDNAEVVYALGLSGTKSINGGQQFLPMTENFNEDVHVDQHALFIDEKNPNRLLLGNDGGLYLSINAGGNWSKINNLPITQFYTCHIDYSQPQRIYGGTQDNSSMRRRAGSQDQWEIIWEGDGFVCLVDPEDNRYVYTESQYGVFVRSTDGGKNFSTALNGIDGNDRKNWNTPVVFNPKNPASLFLGTNRLYKSTDRAISWTPISPSLAGITGPRNYGTITTISVSPLDSQLIYCGTDIGQAWVTKNGGQNWEQISTGLPQRWITSVAADPNIKSKVYITLSGYRYDESMPHVFRSFDYGTGWTDISRGLPPVPCNQILADPALSGHLVVATDAGVWRSYNDGNQWEMPGKDLPLTVYSSLAFHPPTRTLAAASYGRGIYTYILELPVSQKEISPSQLVFQAFPNPVKEVLTVKFSSPKNQKLSLGLIDGGGRVLWNKTIQVTPGQEYHEKIQWNEGTGIYFLRLQENNGESKTLKIFHP